MVKRVLLGAVAVLLIAAGAAAGVIAAWANGQFGTDGVMSFDAGTIIPADASQATVIDIERFGATIPFIGPMGTTSLSVTSGESGDPSDTLFIGAGATADVDAYLKGAPYTVAIRNGSGWTTRDVPGGASAALPRQQGFWLDDSVGRHPDIQVPDLRPLTVVVMHPSGLSSGPVTLGIEFRVPDSATWIVGFAIAAVLLLALGVLLLVVAMRGGRRRGRHEDGVQTAAGETVAVADTVDAGTHVEVGPAADEPSVAADAQPATVLAEPDDEPVAGEPVVDEPVVDEPVVDEPVVDEPVADEPVVDEPDAEPVADEPVADEPVVDEPDDEPDAEPVVDEHAPDA